MAMGYEDEEDEDNDHDLEDIPQGEKEDFDT
jgi:hypothetical protein